LASTAQFLPEVPDKRSVVARLNESIKQAGAFYGAVCFWSIGPDVLDERLVELLGQSGSFCIVDIHIPTNFDNLSLFHQEGGTNFYIFAKQIKVKTGEYYLLRHLLHTKMLVFDMPGNQAEVWIGSHNFTLQALRGINREASMIFSCQQGDPVYMQARTYLESVLADPDCKPFDPSKLHDYKKLQGIPEEEVEVGCYVLPLAWDSHLMPTLSYQTVTLVGNDEEEGRQLFRHNGEKVPLAIRAYDLASDSIRHFSAIVQNQGIIDPNVPSSFDLDFGPRHLAVRPNGIMPYVAPLSEPLTSVQLLEYRFWATVRILDELPEPLDWEPIQRISKAIWETNDEITYELYEDDLYDRVVIGDASESSLELLQRSYTTSDFTDSSSTAVSTRVQHWLDWVTHRSLRRTPGLSKGCRAVFTFERFASATQTELDRIDEQFRPVNRKQLLLDYERPMRERFDGRGLADQTFKDNHVPRLSELLKRYRLKP